MNSQLIDIAALINSLLPHAQDMGHEARANVLRDAAAALRSLAQELERTKDDLRRVQSVYDFAKLSAERDSLAQEVERLKERNSSKIGAIECLKNEVERANKRIRELEAERTTIRADTIEECKKTIINVRFGPPSNWNGDRPRGWHLDRPCTPEEASHHDNGCNDAFMAVSALATASAAES